MSTCSHVAATSAKQLKRMMSIFGANADISYLETQCWKFWRTCTDCRYRLIYYVFKLFIYRNSQKQKSILRSNELTSDALWFTFMKIFLKETLKNICYELNNASFGAFCFRIGQLFQPHRVFEDLIKSDIFPFLKRDRCRIFSRIFKHSVHRGKRYVVRVGKNP